MALVNVADVVPGLAAAKRLYSIGFTQVNNAGESPTARIIPPPKKTKGCQHHQVQIIEISEKKSGFLQLTWT